FSKQKHPVLRRKYRNLAFAGFFVARQFAIATKKPTLSRLFYFVAEREGFPYGPGRCRGFESLPLFNSAKQKSRH
ncbi:MAG TPA: hypothetical protein VIR56_12275, partial [Solimonas sp.]